jgi:hypothetical protein
MCIDMVRIYVYVLSLYVSLCRTSCHERSRAYTRLLGRVLPMYSGVLLHNRMRHVSMHIQISLYTELCRCKFFNMAIILYQHGTVPRARAGSICRRVL